MCVLATFSQYAVLSELSCVKVADDYPFEVGALVGCGIPTGWGSAVYAASVRAGDTVVIYGIGGVGINAVQGARYAGAKNVVAVDPIPLKREKAEELGATHCAASAEDAHRLVWEHLSPGVGADHAVVTAGVVDEEVVEAAFRMACKGGGVTVTGLNTRARQTIHVSGGHLVTYQK